MKIRCFGAAREIAGGPSLHLEGVTGLSILELKSRLVRAYPALGELVSFAIARNEVYAVDTDLIQADDEIVIIPPVSGG